MDIVLKAHNITMEDVYYYTSQNCDELLERCRWDGKIRPCNQLFKKVEKLQLLAANFRSLHLY